MTARVTQARRHVGGRSVGVVTSGALLSFLTRMSLTNRMLVMLITAAVGVFGIVATTMLRQELLPSLQVPSAQVIVTAPGVSPEGVVTQVAEPVEAALGGVADVESVSTTSASGMLQATVTLPFGTDTDEVIGQITSALDGIRGSLPPGANVEVLSASLDDAPVTQLAVSSSDESGTIAQDLEDVVVPRLEQLPGVERAELEGVAEQDLTVTLRPTDLEARDLDAAIVTQVIQANTTVASAGQAEDGDRTLSVEVGGAFSSVDDLRALPLPTDSGPVPLSDIADVELVDAPAAGITRLNGSPAFIISVLKSPSATVVDVSHAVRDVVDDFEEQFGSEVTFVTVQDQAPYIEQSIHDLSVEGGLGLFFAVVVIFVFLGSFRSTIVAAVSIPLSLIVTMIGLFVGDFSLNILTLGALTIAVGRVVDDSIVVIENIKRRQGDDGLTVPGITASVKQVAGAITASTITTVAVFLPIAFVSGLAGQLFSPFAVTVTIALLASLLVSLTVVPVLAYWFLRKPSRAPSEERVEAASLRQESWRDRVLVRAEKLQRRASERRQERNSKRLAQDKEPLPDVVVVTPPTAPSGDGEAGSWFDAMQRRFLPVLAEVLRRPRSVLAGAVALLLLTVGAAGTLATDLIGDQGGNSLTVSQTLPPGSSLETGEAAADALEAVVADSAGVRSSVTTVEGASAGSGEARVSISLALDDSAEPDEVIAELKSRFADAVIDADVSAPSGGLGGEIAIDIRGDDVAALTEASATLRERIEKDASILAVGDNLAAEQPVVRVDVDRQKAARFGFTQAEVGQAVADELRGTTAGTVVLDGVDREITVRTGPVDRPAEDVSAILLPISAIQQQQAIDRATRELEEKQEAIAEAAAADSMADLQEQIDSLRESRAEAADQLAALRSQLEALEDSAIVPGPVPQTPEEQAIIDAAAQRAEQIAQLSAAVTQLSESLPTMDDQIQQLVDAQSAAADQQAQSDELAKDQEALQDLEATPITVGDLATVGEQLTPAAIVRSDGERQVTISATPEEGQLGVATTAIQQIITAADLPDGVSVTVGGASEEQSESFTQLGIAMLIAVMLVFLILVATFRSAVQALVLLASVPFATTGAVIALLVTGTPLGLPAMIGFLMLIGIVVTNAIVLIDLVNKLRRDDVPLLDAVMHGARIRLRPIVMTAAATIFALIPMGLGLTGGGVFISRPLAIVVIGGLISSTLLTLLIVPVLYVMTENRRERRRVAAAS